MDRTFFSKQWAFNLLARGTQGLSGEKYSFDIGEKVKLSLILPSEEPMVTISKKPLLMPQITPPVPSIPMHDSFSRQGGES